MSTRKFFFLERLTITSERGERYKGTAPTFSFTLFLDVTIFQFLSVAVLFFVHINRNVQGFCVLTVFLIRFSLFSDKKIKIGLRKRPYFLF